jgi:arylsulfatase A-like enzyme
MSTGHITRRTFAGLAAAAGLPAQTPRAQTSRRLNLLFILADDHAGYVLGADGNSLARTPNLDRLASEGMRFSRHYCNSPVCTPSRQSFLTGQLPHMAGVTRLPTALDPGKPTLAKQLKLAGYRTAVFGKMHFNCPSAPGLHGFDRMMAEDGVNQAWQHQEKGVIPTGIRTKPAWRPFKDPARIWLNADDLPAACTDGNMKADLITRQAFRYIEENRNQPFALWVSFMEPHSPYDFPLEFAGRFRPDQFRAPRPGPEDGRRIPLIFRDLSDADKRGINAAYYTSVSYLDRNVGRVLDKLRETGLDDKTLVVYMADHGYNLGQHGRFEKHCGYDPALRVPLIMRLPGRVRTSVATDMTEHIDVPATVVDFLDLPPLPVMHGQSLRPYLEGKRHPHARDHIFSEYLENEEAFIRSETHKLIYCTGRRARTDGYATDDPIPGRYKRLYDLKADPGEFTDVAARNAQMVARLEELMLARFRATHPEAHTEPAGGTREEILDWYLRPRD